MRTDYDRLFGQMCVFGSRPPLLFAIPELSPEVYRRLASTHAPVELVVPDLDAFCVPEEDLERIQEAINAAFPRS
ncbi:MAG TPA: hypothetical protein VKB51_16115 [bacterium]|nr:hypothetical protein [bacterium]